jgi:chloramphenicol 3-O phosphotransferase
MYPDTLAGSKARAMMRFTHRRARWPSAVLLNRTSSAGKTTIARSLQRTLEPRWLDLEFDPFVGMLTDETPGSGPGPGRDDLGHWLADEWYRVVGGLAAAGFDVLVEDVILEPYWLDAAIRNLSPFDVTFVAVRCPLEAGRSM